MKLLIHSRYTSLVVFTSIAYSHINFDKNDLWFFMTRPATEHTRMYHSKHILFVINANLAMHWDLDMCSRRTSERRSRGDKGIPVYRRHNYMGASNCLVTIAGATTPLPCVVTSLCNSFDNREPVDEIYGCSIYKRVTVTSLKDMAPHDDVIKWKHFPRYWPFVRGIHRSPVNSPHKDQWRGAVMFSWSASE